MKKLTFNLTLINLLIFLTLSAQDRFIFPMGVKGGNDQTYESMPYKVSLNRNFYTSLSNSVSLEKYAPVAKSQGQFGTCTAWAVTYSARTILEAQRNDWTDKNIITENAFTPAFTYRIVEPQNSECWGAYTGDAIASLRDVGALPLKLWNRAGDEGLCPQQAISQSLINAASDYKIDQYTKLFYSENNNNAKTDAVKLSVSNGNPVVISMICPTSFHRVSGDLWEPEENPAIGDHGRHAMTTVAYDDSKYGGAFLIQNSWGQRYGNDGFVWVKYNDFNEFVYQGIELVQLPKLEPEEPIFMGGLEIVNINTGRKLDFELATKFRNWNTDLGGGNVGEYTYKASEAIKTGTRVRVKIINDQPAFVYILGTGSVDTSVKTLFPYENQSAALSYKKNEVTLPSEDGSFVTDDTVGKDYMIMLFAREELDIKGLQFKLDDMDGDFNDNLKSLLGDKLIPFDEIDFQKSKIQFEAENKGDENKVMAMIIEYDHI